MSGMVNFNAQIAPMEHVEKLVRQEQEHGQNKQSALMQGASQALSQDGKAVQKTAKSRKDRRVDRRKREDENARKRWMDALEEAEGAEDADPQFMEDEEAAQPGSWSGNIVNIKV